MPNILYLHGFASSPQSRKALWFDSRFQESGVQFKAPDLEQDDFTSLTVSGMLQCVRREARGERVTLMGSSLGGYVAAIYAARWPEQVDRLVLMAPAFDFAAMWLARIGPTAAADWRRTGRLPMMHYGRNEMAEIGWSLIDDALTHPAEPDPPQQALVLHGLNDDVVPPAVAAAWCEKSPSRKLVLYEDGHELGAVLEPMWDEIIAFLGI